MLRTNVPEQLSVSVIIVKVWATGRQQETKVSIFTGISSMLIQNLPLHHTLTELVSYCSLSAQQLHHLLGTHLVPYPDLGPVTLLITQAKRHRG